MLRSYFKTAWRQLLNHKIFSIVNIAGLALSLTAFWLIALFVADELSFDRYHDKADRIYRVVSHGRWENGSFDITGTSGALAQSLKNDFPEIEQTVRLNIEGGGIISYGQKKMKADSIMFADNSFFSVFSYSFIAGDPQTALSKPRCIVLTQTLAAKLFGAPEQAINKTLYFQNNFPNLVTGVIRDVPGNSHFTFAAIRSFDDHYTTDPANLSIFTYLLLKPGANAGNLIKKLPAFSARSFPDSAANIKYALELQPLTAIHLHSDLSYELGNNRNMQFIYVIVIIALLILAIALINYVNITTARAFVRLKEVAVRKIIGASKGSLLKLFLTESVTITVLSAALSFLSVLLLLPWFNRLTGKNLELWQFGGIATAASLLLCTLLLGLLGGLYPSLILSVLKIIPSLKNQLGGRKGQLFLRKALVVFQFGVTVVLIALSLLVYRQLGYMLQMDLGFNKSQVLTFHIDNKATREKEAVIKNRLQQHPFIKAAALAGNPIGNNDIGMLDYNPEMNGVINTRASNLGYGLQIDESFIPTLQMKIIDGRNFTKGMASDSQSVLVNEALVKKAGWSNPIGKRIQVAGPVPKIVVGVVRDFHLYSAQHKIEPMVLLLPRGNADKDNVYVRIDPTHASEAIRYIEQTFKSIDPEALFEYHFLDENFARQYIAEERQGKLLLGFTILAIIIAALGLFALITFTAEQRVKEIGIRKVLGATVGNLTGLLSFSLVKLVLAALIIAFPVAFFIMHKWLEDFAYRTSVSWWLFGIAGLLALVIAITTISFQAIRAARANPVKSLRSE